MTIYVVGGNISSIFSGNSEAFALEFPENNEKSSKMTVYLQLLSPACGGVDSYCYHEDQCSSECGNTAR